MQPGRPVEDPEPLIGPVRRLRQDQEKFIAPLGDLGPLADREGGRQRRQSPDITRAGNREDRERVPGGTAGHLIATGEVQAGELGRVEQGLLAELEEALIAPAVSAFRVLLRPAAVGPLEQAGGPGAPVRQLRLITNSGQQVRSGRPWHRPTASGSGGPGLRRGFDQYRSASSPRGRPRATRGRAGGSHAAARTRPTSRSTPGRAPGEWPPPVGAGPTSRPRSQQGRPAGVDRPPARYRPRSSASSCALA